MDLITPSNLYALAYFLFWVAPIRDHGGERVSKTFDHRITPENQVFIAATGNAFYGRGCFLSIRPIINVYHLKPAATAIEACVFCVRMHLV